MTKRNRNSEKGPEKEDRTGQSKYEPVHQRKIKINPRHRADESISTQDGPAEGKYRTTGKRNEETDNSATRDGR